MLSLRSQEQESLSAEWSAWSPPGNLVSGRSLTICNIVCLLPQAQSGLYNEVGYQDTKLCLNLSKLCLEHYGLFLPDTVHITGFLIVIIQLNCTGMDCFRKLQLSLNYNITT